MNPVKIETERGVMTATLTDVENRNALGIAKRLVHEVPRMMPERAFEWTSGLSADLFTSEEAAEGVKAWRDKRSPSWAEGDDE